MESQGKERDGWVCWVHWVVGRLVKPRHPGIPTRQCMSKEERRSLPPARAHTYALALHILEAIRNGKHIVYHHNQLNTYREPPHLSTLSLLLCTRCLPHFAASSLTFVRRHLAVGLVVDIVDWYVVLSVCVHSISFFRSFVSLLPGPSLLRFRFHSRSPFPAPIPLVPRPPPSVAVVAGRVGARRFELEWKSVPLEVEEHRQRWYSSLAASQDERQSVSGSVQRRGMGAAVRTIELHGSDVDQGSYERVHRVASRGQCGLRDQYGDASFGEGNGQIAGESRCVCWQEWTGLENSGYSRKWRGGKEGQGVGTTLKGQESAEECILEDVVAARMEADAAVSTGVNGAIWVPLTMIDSASPSHPRPPSTVDTSTLLRTALGFGRRWGCHSPIPVLSLSPPGTQKKTLGATQEPAGG
ncbi:hypothetical protein BDN71DRAFT_1512991 [Pleurotus eryngii]|uniref:Uncharacterized protein n=1 Tax=Pleurotus eryngii TaxID=5323 RepID=A0A9P5ZI63_PLEER|nr:hypothetical protein BDN71DRAFT_1512991 [Pleurotus eryngii]